MKIYDCFMYMNEDVILDLRLNYLNNYVDFFVIVESTFFHNGKKKQLKFNINNFQKFKNKIIYLVLDEQPKNIENIYLDDSEETRDNKHILNGMKRDFFQRNYIEKGLKNSSDDDVILISDIDEIPKLENFNKNSLKNNIIFFKQKMFYYKFNLCSKSIEWYGTRGCKRKNLKNPQWLRNIKSKYYPYWRLDLFFSSNKIRNAKFIEDGGWHFSYINSAEEIENKLKNYAHYWEYQLSNTNIDIIKKKIKNFETVYDLKADMKKPKFKSGQKLEKVDLKLMPSYLQNNISKYSEWLI
jgi:beta-1,4-mannosyl-glycoprotein beta-1,4-N-acetylglucosaminyltransferase